MSKKKTPELYPIVEVVWIDAIEHGDIGWNDLAELMREARKPCPSMHTVGYCVFHGPDHIALLNTLGSDECSRLDKIPTQFVRSITYLRGEPPKTLDGGPKPTKKPQK
tara:strand:+ start:97 stop:420 length:324 start_codon:yes stop_codon:yes gene_type:complete